MTNPQPQYPAEGGPNILAIVLYCLGGGVLLIVGLLAALITFAPPVNPYPAPATPRSAPENTFDPAAPAPPPASSDSLADCGKPCFSRDDALALAPVAVSLAGTDLAPLGASGDARTQADWVADANGTFYLGGGTPSSCVFAITPAPVAPSTTSWYTDDDAVLDIGSFASGTTTATHLVRVSETVLGGTRYPTAIRNLIKQCPAYSVELATGHRDATVTPLDLGITLPGVTDVAWTQSFGSATVTTADLQRGNLVLRVEVTHDSGAVASDAVTAYLASVAASLSDLPAP